MRALSIDLRARIVDFVKSGGKKAKAARLFKVCTASVHRFLNMDKKGSIAPKTSWGSWKNMDPKKLKAYVIDHPDDTLAEIGDVFGVYPSAVFVQHLVLDFRYFCRGPNLRMSPGPNLRMSPGPNL